MRWNMSTLSCLIAHCSFKVGYRHLWDPCSRLGGSLGSSFSGHWLWPAVLCGQPWGSWASGTKGAILWGLRRQLWNKQCLKGVGQLEDKSRPQRWALGGTFGNDISFQHIPFSFINNVEENRKDLKKLVVTGQMGSIDLQKYWRGSLPLLLSSFQWHHFFFFSEDSGPNWT